MKKTIVLVILSFVFLFSCKQDEFGDAAKSFVSLKNGEKISVNEYEQLRKYANEGGLTIYLCNALEKRYGMHLSQSEIRAVIYNENLRVVLEKQNKVESTTSPQAR